MYTTAEKTSVYQWTAGNYIRYCGVFPQSEADKIRSQQVNARYGAAWGEAGFFILENYLPRIMPARFRVGAARILCTDFANQASVIMDNAARSRGLNPNLGVRAMAAPIRDVDLSKLVPPPTRPFADPGKLQRLGPFDMSKYKPIQVEDIGGGRYMIMDGMTRMEAARLAGMTQLPVQVFP